MAPKKNILAGATASLENTNLVFTSNGTNPVVTLTASSNTLSCSGINGTTNVGVVGVNQLGIIGNTDILQLATGGITATENILLGDNIQTRWGAGNDLSVYHDGTDTRLINTTGDVIIDNQAITKSIKMQLGTNTTATAFEVLSDAGSSLFKVQGDGTITGNLPSSTTVSLTTSDNTTQFVVNNSNNSSVLRASGNNTLTYRTLGNVGLTSFLDYKYGRIKHRWAMDGELPVADGSVDCRNMTNVGTSPVTFRSSDIYHIGNKLLLRGAGSNNFYQANNADPATWTLYSGNSVPGGGAVNGLTLVTTSGIYVYSSDVQYANIDTFDSFSNVGTMPFNIYTTQIVSDDKYYYIVGGQNGTFTNSTSTRLLRINPANPAQVTDHAGMTAGGQSFGIRNSGFIRIRDKIYASGTIFINGTTEHSGRIYSANISDLTTWTDTGNVIPASSDAPKFFIVDDYIYSFSYGSTSIARATVADFINTTAQLTTAGSWSAGPTISGAQFNHPSVLFINGRVYIYGQEGAGTNIYASPAPSTGGSTGNWVFTADDAGLAGNTDLINLSTSLITFSENTKSITEKRAYYGSSNQLSTYYTATGPIGALEMAAGGGTLYVQNFDITKPLVLKTGSTNDTNTSLRYADGGNTVRFQVNANGSGFITGNFDAQNGLDVTGAALTTAVGMTNTAGEVLLSGGNLQLNDNILLTLGDSDDLEIKHVPNDSFIVNKTGTFGIIASGAGATNIDFTLSTTNGTTGMHFRDGASSDILAIDSDGVTRVPDNRTLVFGINSDLTMIHNGTNNVITNVNGNLIIDNTNATGKTQIQLGTDTSATRFEILNNTGTSILEIYGDNTANTKMSMTWNTGFLNLLDNIPLRIGTSNDLVLSHNGTNSLITNITGDLVIDNTNVTGKTQIQLGTDTSATRFEVLNNSGGSLFSVLGDGTITPSVSTGNWVFSVDSAKLAATNNLITLSSNGIQLNTNSTGIANNVTISDGTNTLFSVRGTGEIRAPAFGEAYGQIASLFARNINPFNSTTYLENRVESSGTDALEYDNIGTGFSTASATLYVIGEYVYIAGGTVANILYRAPLSNPTSWTNVGSTPAMDGVPAYYGPTGIYLYGCGSGQTEIWYVSYDDPDNIINTTKTLPVGARLNRVIQTDFGHMLYGGPPTQNRALLIDSSDPSTVTSYGTIAINVSNYGAIRVNGNTYVAGLTLSNKIYRIPDNDPLNPVDTTWTVPVSNVDRPSFIQLGDFVYYIANGTNGIYRAHKDNLNSWTTTGTTTGNRYDTEPLYANGYVYLLDNGFTVTSIYRSRVGGTKLLKGVSLNSIGLPNVSSAGNVTYTPLQLTSGLIYRIGHSASVTDTLPTAASLVAATNRVVGTVIDVTIANYGTGNITVATNTGITIAHNGLTIGPNVTMMAKARITNVGSGTESYDFYVLARVGQ